MKKVFSFCYDTGKCIHRHGCERWVNNYIDHNSFKNKGFINSIDCIKSEPMPFKDLIRFRTSEKRGATL